MTMRRKLSALSCRGVVLVLALLVLTMPVLASGDTVYYIGWAGIELSFPTDYIVVTSGETTGADSNDASTTEDVFLYADWTDAEGNLDFTIQVYDFGDCSLEYATCSDSELNADFANLEAYFTSNYEVLQSAQLSNSYTRFAFFSYIDAGGNYWKSYITGHYQEYTMLELGSAGGAPSWEAVDIMDAMIETVNPVAGSITGSSETGTATDTGIVPDTSGTQTTDTITPLDPPQQVVIAGLEPAEVQVPDYITDGAAQSDAAATTTEQSSGTDYSSTGGKTSESTSSDNVVGILSMVGAFGLILALIKSLRNSKKKKAAKRATKEPVYAASHTPPAASYTPPAASYTPPAASYTPPSAPEADFWTAPVMGSSSDSSYRIKKPDSPNAVKYCPGCGAEQKAGAAFCGKCGRKIG